MRILLLADLHANLAALEAAAVEGFDRLICLGDLVGYGPSPNEVIRFIKERAFVAVRGDHDNALALDVDCHCLPDQKALAEATLAYQRTLLSNEELDWLRALPGSVAFTLDGYRFAAFHATPRNPLFGYEITPELPDDQLREQIEGVKADFILLGHTHLPMVRGIGSRVVVNPGSVGQPADGNPETSYAIIEDGVVELRRAKYDLSETIDALRKLPLGSELIDQLLSILEQGGSGEGPDC